MILNRVNLISSTSTDMVITNGVATLPSFVRINSSTADPQRVFEEAWTRGIAIAYKLDLALQADWSPKYFAETYGHEVTEIEDCATGGRVIDCIGDFFDGFATVEVRTKDSGENYHILKVPDWPTNTDFKIKFPDHFETFYTARNDSAGGAGTTPLHLDMADAVNVMIHASEPCDGVKPDDLRPGAVWDIFPRSALHALRKFVGKVLEERGKVFDDPIHDQTFYLTTDLRARLKEETGVTGWRIFQNPGDAVFVPAGCIHQVCNYRDCIKVACDFVSPESVNYCLNLTKEFRKLNHTHKRKTDVLQLSAILWSTYLTSPFFKENVDAEKADAVEKRPDSPQ
ncbi:hypothetical protein BC829DRAFT_410748 [Chytridium lagenaria]|nr:hypothetical protein BC829DRAFT_410748 [Chytridium lagenaria]